MTRDEYLLLFEKYRAGIATPAEVKMLMHYEDEFELENLSGADTDDAAGRRILKKLNKSTRVKVSKFRFRGKWVAAAAMLLLFISAVLLLNKNSISPAKTSLQTATQHNQIKPGLNQATLTLADGKTIALNDVKVGAVLKHGNISIKKQKNGLMQFALATVNPAAQAVEFNTVSTPAGGQYQVVLPDGSKVWLNSSSSLKFPTVFTGGERRVELSGEGYFEVAKNRELPFKVKFNNQEVEVLGTHFNIMAYKEDEASRTTLLEGSVRISKSGVKKILVPGDQALVTGIGSNMDIQQVNTEAVVAWKNGMFIFNNENIKTIMTQLARWYNIDVVYQGSIKDKEYGIRMARSKSLAEILKNIELTGTIHFKTEGRRVTVME